MKAENLREQTEDELRETLSETERELLELTIKKVTGTLEDSAKVTMLRRDVARIKTVMRERGI